MNISVLYDPRGARTLLSLKYHYIPLLAILTDLLHFSLDLASYPAHKFGPDQHSHVGRESYVHNCISHLVSNKTEKLAILNCIIQCEFCIEMGTCSAATALYIPACIKHVKGDLSLLLSCELTRTEITSSVYHHWFSHWTKFHSSGDSANPVVLLINDNQEELGIVDTGLLERICSHLNGTDPYHYVCEEYEDKGEIQRMLVADEHPHLIISAEAWKETPHILNIVSILAIVIQFTQL